MIKGIFRTIKSCRNNLVICTKTDGYYVAMKYYIAIYICDVPNSFLTEDDVRSLGFGYFVCGENDKYDFFRIEEFNKIFSIVDDCQKGKRIDMLIQSLKIKLSIDVTIMPHIKEDGYWFDYSFYINYPFNVKNDEGREIENFEMAAKKAIEFAKKAYLKAHGKDGITKLLTNTLLHGRS